MITLKPTLTIIAGPNGSGKSTFTRNTQEALGVPVIDPDLEARLLRPDAPETVAVAAGKQAIRRARTYLENNQSFAVETTLSGNTYLKMMREAKQKGWQVNLIYIGLNKVETNIQRVAQRVTVGGHNVPEKDIRRRYERSLANLPLALQQADDALIFDNSTVAGHQNVLTVENGRITQIVPELPEWLRKAISKELIESYQSQSNQQNILSTSIDPQQQQIAQEIYPTALALLATNRNQSNEPIRGVEELEGNNSDGAT
ncbi:zeta toxin family protein [Chroococcidiopsis thermalis]|uniref:UDP-N-acetylglucosamine kinase n=1 Tax=Chroococcidiopsis thermalis (strain PCC 7203) TaxID=251229 RepID=K9U8H4_CHRTP|nr:zeta toxin family protein [Chroococcidiopsis thermalis]AFY91140.1 hypothetical protein Chro_5801 [Chroococcidiopsis thermalis PCC 7203]